tara:strand:+ start:2784 stop:3032 length:249 start_codon:yes stop_codon:yes gene_type:complete
MSKPKRNLTRTSVRLTQETLDDLKFMRQATGLPMSTILEGLMTDFMKDHRTRLERLLHSREQAEKVGLVKTIYENLESKTDL